MKKYLVIGNPIDHSLSPKLQNWWLKENNIDATYGKIKLENHEIKNLRLKVTSLLNKVFFIAADVFF